MDFKGVSMIEGLYIHICILHPYRSPVRSGSPYNPTLQTINQFKGQKKMNSKTAYRMFSRLKDIEVTNLSRWIFQHM